MNVERLERLAKLLDQQTDSCPVKFDLATWGQAKKVEENICGTAACAVGLACLSEDFQAEGLKPIFAGKGIIPSFGENWHWDAVTSFFDINGRTASRLFHENSYGGHLSGASGAHQVAARIREEIKKHKEK